MQSLAIALCALSMFLVTPADPPGPPQPAGDETVVKPTPFPRPSSAPT